MLFDENKTDPRVESDWLCNAWETALSQSRVDKMWYFIIVAQRTICVDVETVTDCTASMEDTWYVLSAMEADSRAERKSDANNISLWTNDRFLSNSPTSAIDENYVV